MGPFGVAMVPPHIGMSALADFVKRLAHLSGSTARIRVYHVQLQYFLKINSITHIRKISVQSARKYT